MSLRQLHDSLGNLDKAMTNLARALIVPRTQELAIEGTIQRFETAVELFWKTLKRGLEFEGYHPQTPRESVRQAFVIGWLDNEQAWFDMLESRNTTSHQYLSVELIEANYDDIHRVFPVLDAAFQFLQRRYPAMPDRDGA